MSEYENSQERARRARSAESRESAVEGKESREDQELKKAAARERAETVSREVKNTKQQMQNIMANMQQVMKAVQNIRAQLQLAQDENIPSIERDDKLMAKLKEKLASLNYQLSDLRGALLAEEENQLRQEQPTIDENELNRLANEQVNKILADLGLEQ